MQAVEALKRSSVASPRRWVPSASPAIGGLRRRCWFVFFPRSEIAVAVPFWQVAKNAVR